MSSILGQVPYLLPLIGARPAIFFSQDDVLRRREVMHVSPSHPLSSRIRTFPNEKTIASMGNNFVSAGSNSRC